MFRDNCPRVLTLLHVPGSDKEKKNMELIPSFVVTSCHVGE